MLMNRTGSASDRVLRAEPSGLRGGVLASASPGRLRFRFGRVVLGERGFPGRSADWNNAFPLRLSVFSPMLPPSEWSDPQAHERKGALTRNPNQGLEYRLMRLCHVPARPGKPPTSAPTPRQGGAR